MLPHLIPAERFLSVSEFTTIFIKSLIHSAEDFLCKKLKELLSPAPLLVYRDLHRYPTTGQHTALEKAATDDGVNVLSIIG